MFQWTEQKSTHTQRNLGGSETTETTYSYRKEWADYPVDSGHFREAGGHHVRWLILEDRRGPLERPRDEAAADQLTREAEAELRTGEKRESDAHDRGPVVLRAEPVLGEGDHLGAILGGCVDRHDGVLRLVVRGERGAMYPSAERFDERSIVRDDERGVVPVGVRLVRAGVAQLLADLDEPREELAAVREDEIARTRVGRPLAGRHVLEARHAASVTGHAACTAGAHGQTSGLHGRRRGAQGQCEPVTTAQAARERAFPP